MSKKIKRLILLSKCPHLNKTDRDLITWAIQNLSPEQPDTPTSFNGWDFSSWPSVPDKLIFEELIKSRKAKRKVIMTQSYIDSASVHLKLLATSGVTVNQSLKVAAAHGWQGFKCNWVLNEIEHSTSQINAVKISSFADVFPMLNKGMITHLKQIPDEYRKIIETQFRLGKYDANTMANLTKIGMAV